MRFFMLKNECVFLSTKILIYVKMHYKPTNAH